VEIAQTKGVGLEAQRSRTVDHTIIEASDLIFVMEKQHYDLIARNYPAAADKTFLLNPDGEIGDPYGKSIEVYLHCLQQVTACVDHLAKLAIEANKT
jgi:protein-tyrosine-phosphatase